MAIFNLLLLCLMVIESLIVFLLGGEFLFRTGSVRNYSAMFLHHFHNIVAQISGHKAANPRLTVATCYFFGGMSPGCGQSWQNTTAASFSLLT